MSEAAIIGRGRSTPGLFSMRRRILRWRRFHWRWRLAFTRKPPGGERLRGVKYLDCSPEPGGFRASRPQSASNYAWLGLDHGSPQPCGDFGVGDREHLLPGRDQVVVGPPRMRLLLLHEFGDVVD